MPASCPARAQDLTARGRGHDHAARSPARSDVDLYRICLTGGGSFSATTVGRARRLDTQLFLFDGAGRGVYANDDGRHQRDAAADDPLTPAAPGVLLGVSSTTAIPTARGTSSDVAYLGAPPAAGPRPARALDGLRASGDYAVTLTGTTVCDSTAPAIDLRSPGRRPGPARELVVDFSCTDEGARAWLVRGRWPTAHARHLHAGTKS